MALKSTILGPAAWVLCAALIPCCSPRYEKPTSSSGSAIALGEITEDRSIYFAEGEDFKERAGGDIDLKGAASNGKCLGTRWGDHVTDFVAYAIDLKETSATTLLVIRAAFEGTQPQFYDVLIDGGTVRRTGLNPTGGYGYVDKEWKCFSIPLGRIEKGPHTLTIRPIKSGQIINIDCFALGKSP